MMLMKGGNAEDTLRVEGSEGEESLILRNQRLMRHLAMLSGSISLH
jgi:hypothetical protein